jgi:hypothetical protein
MRAERRRCTRHARRLDVIADAPGGPKHVMADISPRFRGGPQQKSKYRQGYPKPDAISASASPNDACTRQKLAFTS